MAPRPERKNEVTFSVFININVIVIMKLVVSGSVAVCGFSLHMKRVCNSLINTAISGVVSEN